ncbi:hypothetical protein LTV02_34965 [Nocardia yamanashiensis]|uniref:biotin synthase auxiliary protein BsaP n=1 Tax=Nocardia yamanashiensis TaxID=209247 RepID=UPI001E530573|nr:hypothetical protein [Nocardia yamanashiensis]UGT41099.1 hypothetical protein LTV02_34965 [Nocardia yamanashiensis]
MVVDIEERYNPFTGKRVVPGLDDPIPPSAALGLEPPRFCQQCGRRMIVQVSPDGWWAKCSRHGVLDSSDLERR